MNGKFQKTKYLIDQKDINLWGENRKVLEIVKSIDFNEFMTIMGLFVKEYNMKVKDIIIVDERNHRENTYYKLFYKWVVTISEAYYILITYYDELGLLEQSKAVKKSAIRHQILWTE